MDARWLERHGISRGLRKKYVTNGWLDRIERSVYRRPVARVSESGQTVGLRWQNVVISLQTLLGYDFVIGGRTALELQGFSHYLSAAGPKEIHLYGHTPPPGWLSKLRLDARFVWHNAGRLFQSAGESGGLAGGLWTEREWPLVMSSPELAVLELLDELPRKETFEQVDVLMEGLRNLSPRRLERLLEDCRSVKVKRLFFWFAERHNHPWIRRIDRSRIDLGSGKRMLVRKGKLDPKYQITVPETLVGHL